MCKPACNQHVPGPWCCSGLHPCSREGPESRRRLRRVTVFTSCLLSCFGSVCGATIKLASHSVHLDHIADCLQLLHLLLEGGVHPLKQHRLLGQLLANVLRPNEDVLKVHPVALHLHSRRSTLIAEVHLLHRQCCGSFPFPHLHRQPWLSTIQDKHESNVGNLRCAVSLPVNDEMAVETGHCSDSMQSSWTQGPQLGCQTCRIISMVSETMDSVCSH